MTGTKETHEHSLRFSSLLNSLKFCKFYKLRFLLYVSDEGGQDILQWCPPITVMTGCSHLLRLLQNSANCKVIGKTKTEPIIWCVAHCWFKAFWPLGSLLRMKWMLTQHHEHFPHHRTTVWGKIPIQFLKCMQTFQPEWECGRPSITNLLVRGLFRNISTF